MHTFQISESLLENFRNDKLSDVRINFLITQANEQLWEMAQNKELYDSFLTKVKAPERIDNIILWILLMSNETIGSKYIREFKKDFRKFIPVSDLADLLLYAIYLKKVKNMELDGFDYLFEYEEEGMEIMDQYAFTNVLLYIQSSKEVQMEF